MTDKDFDEVVDNRLKQIKQVLSIKAKEYVRNSDRLHNFNVGANIAGISRERVLDGFLLKHYISYRDMINDIDSGKLPTKEYIEEKIGDIINYMILLEASIKNKIKDNEERKNREGETTIIEKEGIIQERKS